MTETGSGVRVSWADDDAVLREVYADDAIAYPVIAAAARLPHRTAVAVQVRASALGLARERAARRAAAGLAKPAPPKRTALAPKPSMPLAAKVSIQPGPCDRGDREIIRKRLLYTIGALASELRRAPAEVAATVQAIAEDKFREPTMLGAGPLDLGPTGRTTRGVATFRNMAVPR